ncbi:MAG: GNAT family N-acetyltransferase, partial [Aeromicrobium sp.]|nr:GNAT family N-acetyltransferase [Burkholderiales bacterium]
MARVNEGDEERGTMPAMALVIRPSRDADVEFIAPIYAESVRSGTASWEYEPPSLEEFAARRRDILAEGFPYLVAELDGVPVGYSYASSYRARIGYRFT